MRIQRYNNDVGNTHTKYCPMCASINIEVEVSPEKVFDESGWYNSITIKCQENGCKHTWTEKLLQTERSVRL
jgi:hypothetical protein